MDFPFPAFMTIMAILIVVTVVVGYFVLSASLRAHDAQRDEDMSIAARLRKAWESRRPDGYGHS